MDNKIGIVTILYNSEAVLDDFFESLSHQTFKNFILYIVDNLSPDNSLSRAKSLGEKVDFECVYIENDQNFGVAKGNNIGIKAALKDGCNYILLSNNDIVLNSNTIENLLSGIVSYKADLAVPKIYFWNTNKLLWMAGGKFRWLQGTTLHFGFRQPDSAKFNQLKAIEYAPTCFMLIKSKIFKEIGYMDEVYFVYYDDSDFLWRVRKHHKKLIYVPTSTLYHKVSVSTGGSESSFSIKYSNRNQIFFIKKNFGPFHKWVSLIYVYLRFYLKQRSINSVDKNKLILDSFHEGSRLYKQKRSNAE